MSLDNIDRFGHCVLCHKNLIVKKVVDGKVIDMFLPEHGHADFMLNNGSMMKVCMCSKCRDSQDLHDPTVHENIMEACFKGWELETNILVKDDKFPEWTKEYGDSYLNNMKELSIGVYADNVDKNFLLEKSKLLSNEFMKSRINDVSFNDSKRI